MQLKSLKNQLKRHKTFRNKQTCNLSFTFTIPVRSIRNISVKDAFPNTSKTGWVNAISKRCSLKDVYAKQHQHKRHIILLTVIDVLNLR